MYHMETGSLHGVDFRHIVRVHGQEERHRAALGEHEGVKRFPRFGRMITSFDSSSLGDDSLAVYMAPILILSIAKK